MLLLIDRAPGWARPKPKQTIEGEGGQQCEKGGERGSKMGKRVRKWKVDGDGDGDGAGRIGI